MSEIEENTENCNLSEKVTHVPGGRKQVKYSITSLLPCDMHVHFSLVHTVVLSQLPTILMSYLSF